MPVVSENVHPRSLTFPQQRRLVLLRDVQKLSWEAIAKQVVNRLGQRPSWKTCANLHEAFKRRKNRAPYKYHRCGRKSTLTKADEDWLVKRLETLRATAVCTSVSLRRDLAKTRKVVVSAMTVRRVLQARGLQWLQRSKKPKYSDEVKACRLAFAVGVLAMTEAALRKKLSLAMDGVVLSAPPSSALARQNFCKAAETHVWRLPSERNSPALAGADPYRKQVPVNRALPLWGGVSAGGFAVVLWHEGKKVTAEEWAAAVKAGKLTAAVRKLKPTKPNGPWFVLADNESFPRAPASRREHEKANATLWDIPPKSPDLNPVELFWAWTRAALARMDLRDLQQNKAAITKNNFKVRVQSLFRTKKAQRVAASCARNLRKVCQEVQKVGGAASSF